MKTNTITKTIIKATGASGLAVLTFLVSGCGRHSKPTGQLNQCHLYAGLDTSASWRPYLGVSATLCSRQALGLDPDRDLLTLYRLDSSTREFSDGPAPESGDRLQQTIVNEVSSISESRGTFPARFWTAVAKRAEDDAGTVSIEVFTDGDNDDQSAQSSSAIKAAARQLSANKHVAGVYIFGAQSRNWEVLRDEFAPLKDKFHLCSPSEMTADRVASALP